MMKQPTMMPTVLAAFFSRFRLRSWEMMCSLANRDAMSDVRFSAADVTDDVTDDVDVRVEEAGGLVSWRAKKLVVCCVLTSSQLRVCRPRQTDTRRTSTGMMTSTPGPAASPASVFLRCVSSWHDVDDVMTMVGTGCDVTGCGIARAAGGGLEAWAAADEACRRPSTLRRTIVRWSDSAADERGSSSVISPAE